MDFEGPVDLRIFLRDLRLWLWDGIALFGRMLLSQQPAETLLDVYVVDTRQKPEFVSELRARIPLHCSAPPRVGISGVHDPVAI